MSAPTRWVSQAVVMKNTALLAWARTLCAVVAGLAAGICGATGVAGVGVYVASHVAISLALVTRVPGALSDTFPDASSPALFVVGGLMDNALLFIVFWALGFAGLWVF